MKKLKKKTKSVKNKTTKIIKINAKTFNSA